MKPFNRPAPIKALQEKWEYWTKNWVKRRAKNNGASFYWPKYPDSKGVPVNQLIAPVLFIATNWHCAYCDRFPLHRNDETIDHFKPKSQYPELAFKWENMYPVCDSCQSAKMEHYNDHLLRPDEDGFDFHRYFLIDYTTFELHPNPMASAEDKTRAAITIQLLGLKQRAHCTARRHHHQRYYKDENPVLEDYAYRYMF